MITATAAVLPGQGGRTSTAACSHCPGLVQFDPGCVDVKAKLIVLTGVVCKK